MSVSLDGRTALVTGAARGIGRGIALALAEAGCHLALVDLPGDGSGFGYALSGDSELEAATAEVASRGAGEALAITADVTDAAQVAAAIEQTTKRFGGLDLLVNNAGVVHMMPLAQLEEEAFDRVHAVNVKGVYLMSRAALPLLLDRKGSIVNIASVAGKRGYTGGTAYCSSKFAVVGFTQSLAMELAPQGVRVNAVCPGLLPTHMWTHHLTSEERGGKAAYAAALESLIPLGTEQTPEDIAEAVLYLARAEQVTGVALNVAGGMEVW